MNAQYAERGYQHFEGLIDSQEVDRLRRAIHEAFRRQFAARDFRPEPESHDHIPDADLIRFFKEHETGYIGSMRVVQNLIELSAIGALEELTDAVRSLGLRKPVFSTPPLVMLSSRHTAKNSGYWRLPAHQDWRSIQGSLNCLVVWIPLVDVSEEMGPLSVIPGSHLKGLLPSVKDEWYAHVDPEYTPDDAFISVPMKAGDALCFSAFLVHRSGVNTSDRIRYSLQYRYNDLDERTFADRGYPNPYTTRPQFDLITPGFPEPDAVRAMFNQSQLS